MIMAFCVNCGKDLPKGAEFCPNCGQPVKDEVVDTAKTKDGKHSRVDAVNQVMPPQTAQKKDSPIRVSNSTKLNLPIMIIAVAVIVIALIAVFILVAPILSASKNVTDTYVEPTDIVLVEVCEESWVCGPWSECNESTQSRECIDQNHCGTNEQGIISSRPCTETPKTYCGDGNCDRNENCASCPSDCGNCLDDEENVFEEPIYYIAEQEYKEEGYALVKYFYSPDCIACTQPLDIAAELESLAEEFKGLMILVEIDSSKYPDMAKTQAKVGGIVYVPFIKIEGYKAGVHSFTTIYGLGLERRLDDFAYSVAEDICDIIDGCYYENKVMHRT
jgi:hypothetical protein